MKTNTGITKFSVLFLLFINSFTVFGQENLMQSIFTIEPQTRIKFRLDNEINSRAAGVNDTFTATISEPFYTRGAEILPEGTTVEGKILSVKQAGGGFRNGIFTIKFAVLKLPDGTIREIDADLTENPDAEKKSGAPLKSALVLGETAIGAVIGGLLGKGSGAILGAGAGAGAGIATVFAVKGKEMRIKTDEEFEIKFNKRVNLPVQDY